MGYPQTYITGVINESCLISRHCSVHNIVFINSEHVSPETLGEVCERSEDRQRTSQDPVTVHTRYERMYACTQNSANEVLMLVQEAFMLHAMNLVVEPT